MATSLVHPSDSGIYVPNLSGLPVRDLRSEGVRDPKHPNEHENVAT